MDVVHALFAVLMPLAKVVSFYAPPLLLLSALVRIQGAQPVACKIINTAFSTLGFFFYAGMFALRQASASPLATTRPSSPAKVFQFWNDHYFSFWSQYVNPFRYPILRGIRKFLELPHGNGMAVCAVAVILVLLSTAIAHFAGKSAGRQPVAIAAYAGLGWYVCAMMIWGGPLLIGIAVAGVIVFQLLRGLWSLNKVPVVRVLGW